MNYVKEAKKLLAKEIDVPDDLLNLYVLLVLNQGRSTSWEDVHNAWSVWENMKQSQHKSLVPFKELPLHIQSKDEEYAVAIKLVARKVHKY